MAFTDLEDSCGADLCRAAEAFVAELLDGVANPALRDACRGRVGGWFGEDATLPENAG